MRQIDFVKLQHTHLSQLLWTLGVNCGKQESAGTRISKLCAAAMLCHSQSIIRRELNEVGKQRYNPSLT